MQGFCGCNLAHRWAILPVLREMAQKMGKCLVRACKACSLYSSRTRSIKSQETKQFPTNSARFQKTRKYSRIKSSGLSKRSLCHVCRVMRSLHLKCYARALVFLSSSQSTSCSQLVLRRGGRGRGWKIWVGMLIPLRKLKNVIRLAADTERGF